jgi:hypothetical protein
MHKMMHKKWELPSVGENFSYFIQIIVPEQNDKRQHKDFL